LNGKKLYFQCAGSGTPTVVLAGLGENNVVWDDVVERIAHFTRVCAYDRFGLGFSEGICRPRSSADFRGSG
jgi:pimeloyl-ACP methyl ester carboxylesterase